MNGTSARSRRLVSAAGSSMPPEVSRSAPAGWAASTRAMVSCSRPSWSASISDRWSVSTLLRGSDAALVGIPVALQVLHECGAEVAVRLLARVGGHVLAEQVEGLSTRPHRRPVGGRVDQPGTRERVDAVLQCRVHLIWFDDLVAQLFCVRLPRLPLPPGEDRLPGG